MRRDDGLSRRTELKRVSVLKRSDKGLRRTRLKPVSSKARAHYQRMNELRPTVFAAALWRCQVRAFGCYGAAQHAHHVLPRGKGGPDTFENLLAVCATCHLFIHDNPRWAAERGYLAAGYGRGDDAA